jgi:hypothetical protein
VTSASCGRRGGWPGSGAGGVGPNVEQAPSGIVAWIAGPVPGSAAAVARQPSLTALLLDSGAGSVQNPQRTSGAAGLAAVPAPSGAAIRSWYATA